MDVGEIARWTNLTLLVGLGVLVVLAIRGRIK